MITYNWNCKTVDCYPEQENNPDVVYNVHWIVTGVSDELKPDDTAYSSNVIGTQSLNTEDITVFIPFEDLTNEEVTAWTKGAMGEEKVLQIEAIIATQVEDMLKAHNHQTHDHIIRH